MNDCRNLKEESALTFRSNRRHFNTHKIFVAHITLLTFLLSFAHMTGCNGESLEEEGHNDNVVSGRLSGLVFKGALADGHVRVLSLADGSWSKVVAEGRTNRSGEFQLDVGLARGNLLIEVSGGAYIEEATGESVGLDKKKLRAWLPAFEVGTHKDDIQINPITTLIVAYSTWRMETLGESLQIAESIASRYFEEHFGGADWRSRAPQNPTATPNLPFSSETIMGILISGLSRLTQEITQTDGEIGRSINTATLIELLAEDIQANGRFNGIGKNNRRLMLNQEPLDEQTLRFTYARSILNFLESDRNISGITAGDMESLMLEIANRDSALFESSDQEWTLDRPVIFLEYPMAGSALTGEAIKISARAEDTGKIVELGILEPSEILIDRVVGLSTSTAVIEASLNAGNLSDGSVELVFFAANERGLSIQSTFEFFIANASPVIRVQAPSALSKISGTVEIRAHAEPNPLSGASVREVFARVPEDIENNLNSPDEFKAYWDTTQEPEGPFTIELAAIDEFGSEGSVRIPVEISNRIPTTIQGVARIADSPIRGARVHAFTLSLPETHSTEDPVRLGSAITDEAGFFTLQIKDKNYRDPIVIRVKEGGEWTSPLSKNTFSTDKETFLSAYLPSPDYLITQDGSQPRYVVVSAWTTLANELAQHYMSMGASHHTHETAWTKAQEMIGGHFLRDNPPDLLTTGTGRDLTRYPSNLRDSIYMLGDFGLVWLVKDRQDISAMELIAALRNDISTGRFNGHDGHSMIGSLGNVSIDVDTTRWALASAIYQFVNSEYNDSGIDSSDLLSSSWGRKTYLDSISADEREIYGVPGRIFDRHGPQITWLHPNEPDLLLGNETLLVAAEAYDDNGIRSFTVTKPLIKGRPPLNDSNSTDRLRFEIDNTLPPNSNDYYIQIEVLATDSLGNETRSHRRFTRQAPSASITDVQWLNGHVWDRVTGPISGRLRVLARSAGGFATERFELVSPPGNNPAVGANLAQNGDSIEIEIEPGHGLDDGPLEIQVCHTTIDGRTGCDSRNILIDTTPPNVLLRAYHSADQEVWVGCPSSVSNCVSTSLLLEYEVSDATSGVRSLKLHVMPENSESYSLEIAEYLPGSCVDSSCIGQFEIDLEHGEYSFILEAVDFVGHRSTSKDALRAMVDTHIPIIEDRSGTFENEDQLDFVRDGSSFVYQAREDHSSFDISDAQNPGAAQWVKMEHRISAQNNLEAIEANIPIIKLEAWDDGEHINGAGPLQVEYLNSWSLTGQNYITSPTGWRSVSSSSEGNCAYQPETYELPISLEFFGEELMLYPHHSVTIRAVDSAGNKAKKTYYFQLQLIPAPIAIEIDDSYPLEQDPRSIYSFGFEQGNLDQLFENTNNRQENLRIAKLTVHQPHQGIEVLVKADVMDDINLQRERVVTVVPGSVTRHFCLETDCFLVGGILQCRGCATYRPAFPEDNDPPCLNTRYGEERKHMYMILGENAGTCYDDRVVEMQGAREKRFTHTFERPHSMVAFYNDDGTSPPRTKDGSFILANGTYTAYIYISRPTDYISSSYTAGTITVQGRIIEERIVYHGDYKLRWAEKEEDGICVRDRQCWDYDTRREEIVLYESGIIWSGTRNNNGVGMRLFTGSVHPSVNSWRDPYTAGRPAGGNTEEIYPVFHISRQAEHL